MATAPSVHSEPPASDPPVHCVHWYVWLHSRLFPKQPVLVMLVSRPFHQGARRPTRHSTAISLSVC